MKKNITYLLIFLIILDNVFSQNSQDKYTAFLYESSFSLGESHIKFNNNNTYMVTTYSGDVWTGTFFVKGNRLKFNNDVKLNDFPTNIEFCSNWFGQSFKIPGEYIVDPDYRSLFDCGIISDLDGNICTSKKYSGGEKIIYENMEIIISEPFSFLYVKENTKMRAAPNLKAKVIDMPYLTKDYDYIQSRNVVFRGELPRILACSTFEETIDNVTSKWYLILESDGNSDIDHEGMVKYVWIFGGWCELVSSNNYEYYSNLSKQNKK